MAVENLYIDGVVTAGIFSTNSGNHANTAQDPTTGQPDASSMDSDADNQTAGTPALFSIDDLTGNVGDITGIVVRVWADDNGQAADDSSTWRCRLLTSGGTPIVGVGVGFNNLVVSSGTVTTSGLTSGSAPSPGDWSEADINGARIEFDNASFSKTKGNDGIVLSVHAVEVEVTYNEGATINDVDKLDTIAVTDTVEMKRLRFRELLVAIALGDAVVPTYTPVPGIINDVTKADSITVGDTPAMRRHRDRESFDSITMVDLSPTMLRHRIREILDSIITGDNVVAQYTGGGPVYNNVAKLDSIAVTDVEVFLRYRDREGLSVVAVNDVLRTLRLRDRAITDPIALVDTIEMLRQRNRAMLDSLTVVDQLNYANRVIKRVTFDYIPVENLGTL